MLYSLVRVLAIRNNKESESVSLICLWECKTLTYVDAQESIVLAYGMEMMVGEDEMEWKPAKAVYRMYCLQWNIIAMDI